MAEERCSALVWDRNTWRYVSCSRKGTIQRNGEWYCWQHDPEVKKKRDEKRERRYLGEQEEMHRKWAALKVCNGVSTEILESLPKGELARLLAKETPNEQD